MNNAPSTSPGPKADCLVNRAGDLSTRGKLGGVLSREGIAQNVPPENRDYSLSSTLAFTRPQDLDTPTQQLTTQEADRMATETPRDGGGEERGPICGIPCSLESPELRRAIQLVLGQIRERAPEDFQRIRALVGACIPLPASAASTRGEWKHGTRWTDFTAAGAVQLFEAPGEVEVVASDPDPVPTLAHELGHVCTRQADREARTGGPRYEWVRELCADFYASKWGFGQDIERARGRRAPWHHGPAPGATFTRADGGVLSRYRVTADFCLRLVQSETPDGRPFA
jgi:hypothetical protein